MLPASRLVPALCILLLSAVACSHNRLADPSYARPCPSPEGCVTFRVYSAGAADQPHGTPVFLLSASGISPLGATDDDGVFLLPKADLEAPGLLALHFCWDTRSLACTAVRLDSHAVSSYDWLNVSLPANPLLHRSQALPSPQATPVPRP